MPAACGLWASVRACPHADFFSSSPLFALFSVSSIFFHFPKGHSNALAQVFACKLQPHSLHQLPALSGHASQAAQRAACSSLVQRRGFLAKAIIARAKLWARWAMLGPLPLFSSAGGAKLTDSPPHWRACGGFSTATVILQAVHCHTGKPSFALRRLVSSNLQTSKLTPHSQR